MDKFNQGPEQIPQPKNHPESITIEEAVGFIGTVMEECAIRGANDSEMPDLAKLMKAVENKEINPAKAKEIAQQIKNSKMDYR